jgi:hypothetical protein
MVGRREKERVAWGYKIERKQKRVCKKRRAGYANEEEAGMKESRKATWSCGVVGERTDIVV